MEVHNEDTVPTANPRAQLQLSSTRYGMPNGSEFWWGTGIYLPADFPVIPPTAEGEQYAGWWVFAEVYGAPSSGQSSATFGSYGDDPETLMMNVKGDADDWFSNRVWHMPLLREQWIDFAWHVKLSTHADIGFYELYVNTGEGWIQQLLDGKKRLNFTTLNSTHNVGPNMPTIKNYRKVDTLDIVTAYYAGQKIGKSLADVDIHSHD